MKYLVQKIAQLEGIEKVASSNKFFLFPLDIDILKAKPEQFNMGSDTNDFDPWNSSFRDHVKKHEVDLTLVMDQLNDSRLWFIGLTGTTRGFNPALLDKRSVHWITQGSGTSWSTVTRSEVQILGKVVDEKLVAMTRLLKTTKPINQKEMDRLRSKLPSLWKRLFWKYKEVDDFNEAWTKRQNREDLKDEMKHLRDVKRQMKVLDGAKSVLFTHHST